MLAGEIGEDLEELVDAGESGKSRAVRDSLLHAPGAPVQVVADAGDDVFAVVVLAGVAGDAMLRLPSSVRLSNLSQSVETPLPSVPSVSSSSNGKFLVCQTGNNTGLSGFGHSSISMSRMLISGTFGLLAVLEVFAIGLSGVLPFI